MRVLAVRRLSAAVPPVPPEPRPRARATPNRPSRAPGSSGHPGSALTPWGPGDRGTLVRIDPADFHDVVVEPGVPAGDHGELQHRPRVHTGIVELGRVTDVHFDGEPLRDDVS
ncbi:hypothetical protein ACIQ6K_16225 [Streptomyces sp. NPDC096354]|uniref:hypothetical protein n=1 Tax=Streptomyces sp. NPDC096354 TaxID=3366088 RepID=UPI003824889E